MFELENLSFSGRVLLPASGIDEGGFGLDGRPTQRAARNLFCAL